MVAVPFWLAAKGQPLPVAERAGCIGLIEPDAFNTVSTTVAEHDTDNRPAIRQAPAANLHNLTTDCLQLTGAQGSDRPYLGQIIVGAREMKEQVADGLDPQAAQKLRSHWSDALQVLRTLSEWVGGAV